MATACTTPGIRKSTFHPEIRQQPTYEQFLGRWTDLRCSHEVWSDNVGMPLAAWQKSTVAHA
jgi:hypothetical protein